MIDRKEMDSEVSKAIKQMEAGDILTFKTYKKDRLLTLSRTTGGFTILEDGYQKKAYPNLDGKTTKKKMKELIDLEFPRSNKVWIQKSKGGNLHG